MRDNSGYPKLVERAFVEIVAERVRKRGFKHARFAALVWPEVSPNAANSRWIAIRRKARNTGRPQGVQISDAVRMANVLEEDISFLLALATDAAQKTSDALLENPDEYPGEGFQ